MEDVPITGLAGLEKHLQQLAEEPDTPLDAKLFDEVELQLTGKSESYNYMSVWARSCCYL